MIQPIHLSNLIFYHALLLFSVSSYTDLLAAPGTHLAYFHLKTFALAVPRAQKSPSCSSNGQRLQFFRALSFTVTSGETFPDHLRGKSPHIQLL